MRILYLVVVLFEIVQGWRHNGVVRLYAEVEVLGRRRLEDALDSMTESERYEAAASASVERGEILEALQLLEEGNIKSAKVARSIVDAVSSTRSAADVDIVFSENRRLFSRYGSTVFKKEEARQNWSNLFQNKKKMYFPKKIQADARLLEMAVASAAGFVVVGSSLTSAFDLFVGIDPTLPEVSLAALFAGCGFDVFSNEAKISKLALAGADRLLGVDAKRISDAQAASLLIGYLGGLPCFPFAPTAFEASLLLDQVRPEALLVWLAAPLAAEAREHADFRAADPRQPLTFLELASSSDINEDTLQWAATEANDLITQNAVLHAKLSEYLRSQAATAGDCVILIEDENLFAPSQFASNLNSLQPNPAPSSSSSGRIQEEDNVRLGKNENKDDKVILVVPADNEEIFSRGRKSSSTNDDDDDDDDETKKN